MDLANSPPIPHLLRPHHIGVLVILILYFRGVNVAKPGRLPQIEPLHFKIKMTVLRVLAREIGEMEEATPLAALVERLTVATDDKKIRRQVRSLHQTILAVADNIRRPEVLSDLIHDTRSLVAPQREEGATEDDGPHIFERRSYFGMFVRRCYLSFRKLSFAGQIRLLDDFLSWRNGDKAAGYDVGVKERLNGLQMFPVILDVLQLSKSEHYNDFQSAQKSGEYNVASDSMRRFFDQRFAMTDDSTLYQHALLSMARMHYEQGELSASRRFLTEAIRISREKNDPITLDACQSLMQRLDPDPATSFLAHDRRATMRPGLSPFDVLWEIKRLLDLGEGIQLCFVKVYEAFGVYDAKLRSNLGYEKWARHAVVALLWRLAGVETLARVNERIIMTFVPVGDDDARIAVICSQASVLTRQGQTDEALQLLLDPQTWRGLNFRQYPRWTLELWKTFDFVAERRGQQRLRETILSANRPPNPPVTQSLGRMQHSLGLTKKTLIVERLREAIDAKERDLPIQALKPLMEAIWSAEIRGMFSYYRIAVVLLADIGLDMNLSLTCLAWLDEIFPQILLGDDLELRAYASMTYARCLFASCGDNPTEPKLKETRPHLLRAIRDYRFLKMYDKTLEALYTLSVVCHNLNSEAERDTWALQFDKMDKERIKAAEEPVGEELLGALWVMRQAGHVVGNDEKGA